ncbi:HAD-IIB family hydrolase [Candidatus Woesearchaeota archaeon]|jgi:phosphomannomutase|nr:HAD-IIB family hydrolase [Candidatus Woesearchaeota archaeon]MBT4321627.1 HAD-IIB family hydrolase [Candidatus Woesearchaeota archaeon]MBT4631062.1 HAD-IIB family hydrolase [Candidatus Woesearchaeota archaeon]
MDGKDLIIFDLDGTLAESKTEMDEEMSELFSKLLSKKKVAIISGGTYTQFKKQFLEGLDCSEELLKNLYLFPVCSTQFYKFNKEWEKIYSEELTNEEIEKIIDSLYKSLDEFGFDEKELYGERIENRGSQVTFSALGQDAPTEKKSCWDVNLSKRRKIKKILEKYIPEFEIRLGGVSSIDITRKGIDKSYGIKQIEKNLGYSIKQMLFIGDALFEGGNDYPVKSTGVTCMAVSGPEETKKIVRGLI